MALVILGHPAIEKSFANKTIVDELEKSHLEIEIRNIQKLYPDYKINAKTEHQVLLRHQTVVFQYPFYWYNMPAILKHWFDAVFVNRFAFGANGDKLKGKNFIPSFTVGGAESGYRTFGKHHFRVHEFCKNLEQTAYFAQMNYIDPIYLHKTSLADGYEENEIKANARKHAQRLITQLEKLK